jgi:hypothetical protein
MFLFNYRAQLLKDHSYESNDAGGHVRLSHFNCSSRIVFLGLPTLQRAWARFPLAVQGDEWIFQTFSILFRKDVKVRRKLDVTTWR